MSVSLHAREAGAGAPMLLLHGLFGSSRNWMTVQKHLAAHRRVIALDLRNHGSSGHAPGMRYADMADDVLDHLAGRGIDGPVTVLGHSMGGKVAMLLALLHPARVDRLIVVDIAPVRYPPHHTAIVAALQGLDLAALNSRRDAEAQLAAAIPEDDVRGFLLQNLVQSDGRWSWRIHLPGIADGLDDLGDFPLADDVAPYGGPTLFLCGGASDYVTSARHEAIRKHFPGADIMTFPGVGHWPHAQIPEAFIAQVAAFIGAGTIPA